MRMKDLKEMTLEEITAEMRGYECRKDRGYAFISYSHRDREQVYPLVLSWMRAGYNIYIDLDFERHGSDSNWADLMLSTLSSRLCRLGVCFKSPHYRYSYAALLELLTMRGETVTNRHSGKRLYVDSVALGTIPDDDEIPENHKEAYASAFRSMRSGMGERFLGQNRKEAGLLLEGLDFWLKDSKTKAVLRTSADAGKMAGYIQDAYQAGYQDFFPQIAYLVKNWFISQDLNGNDYSLNSSPNIRFARFNEVRVEQVRESLLPPALTAPPVLPQAETGKKPAVGESPYPLAAEICHWENGAWKPVSSSGPARQVSERTAPPVRPVPGAAAQTEIVSEELGPYPEGELLETSEAAYLERPGFQLHPPAEQVFRRTAETPASAGAGMGPRLSRVDKSGLILIPEGSFKLGRSKTCDYQITGNSAVGRVHAILYRQGDTVTILDQHSKNYTLVNGRALNPERAHFLVDGDTITISDAVFVFHQ